MVLQTKFAETLASRVRENVHLLRSVATIVLLISGACLSL